MTTLPNPNLYPVPFDPVEEVLDHVHELPLWDKTYSTAISVEHAFEQLEAFEIPITVDTSYRVMKSFFGEPRYSAADHESMSPHELSVLYPGITSQLLSWYVSLT